MKEMTPAATKALKKISRNEAVLSNLSYLACNVMAKDGSITHPVLAHSVASMFMLEGVAYSEALDLGGWVATQLTEGEYYSDLTYWFKIRVGLLKP